MQRNECEQWSLKEMDADIDAGNDDGDDDGDLTSCVPSWVNNCKKAPGYECCIMFCSDLR